MLMFKRLVAALCVIMGTTTLALAQDEQDERSKQDVTFEIEGRYWFPDFKGDLRVGLGSIRGTELDIERDLDLDLDKDIPIGRVTWYTGPKSRIFFEYRRAQADGEVTTTTPITFKDATFDVNARLASELEIDFYRLGWVWQFISLADGKFELGTQLEARYVDASATLEGQIGGQSASRTEDIAAPLPLIGLALDWYPIDELDIFASAVGIPEIEGASYLSAEAGVKFVPIRNLSISGGWRHEEVKVEDDEDFVDVQFTGPFAAVSLRF